MKIYLTVDFFLQDWIGDPNGVFWICVQPHIQLSDTGNEIADFIANIHEFRSFEYTLWNRSDAADGLVPVPLPSNADLFLDLLSSTDEFEPLDNLRRSAVRIKKEDWPELYRANSDPGSTLPFWPPQRKRQNVDIPSAPFAIAYNASLIEAWREFRAEAARDARINPVTHAAQMLRVAFWGGSQWRIPAGVQIDMLHGVDLMALPDPPDFSAGDLQITTNLHSLVGLIFRVCKRSEASDFTGVTDLQLRLEDGQPNPITIRFSTFHWATGTINAFFSTLMQDPPNTLAKAAWREGFQKRVYVSDALTMFAPQPLDETVWFRRRQEDQSEGADLLGHDLRSFVVRPNGNVTDTPPQLTLTPHDAFEVSLVRYRDSRAQADGRGLLQLKPKPGQQARFYDEMRAHGDPATWLSGPDRPRFVDAKGNSFTPELVGIYTFDWDQEDLTILFYGRIPEGEQAALIVRRPCEPIIAKLKGADPTEDPFGLRYEVKMPSGIGNFHFDMLEIVADTDLKFLKSLAPAASFAGQHHFEPVQSVSNIEGILEVRYPKPADPPNENTINAAEEYLHDLLNYNALNVFAQYETESKPLHLNPRTELYPLFKRPANSGDPYPVVDDAPYYINYFQFRYTQSLLPDETIPAPIFFTSLYAKLGAGSAITFNIEHTYGFTKPLDVKGRGYGAATWRPILPNELTLTGKAAEIKPDHLYFCTASLLETTPEKIRLRFDPEWITQSWANDVKLRPFYLAAWRSIAELANASSIIITGRFLRFNFQRALKEGRYGELAAGLEPIPEFDPWELNITERVRNTCHQWLLTGAIDNAVLDFDAAAPVSISNTSLVVELLLGVKRDPKVLPIVGDEAVFVRAAATFMLNEEGQVCAGHEHRSY